MATSQLDPMRTMAHGMWEGVASQWAAHAEVVDTRGAALTERMLDAVGAVVGMQLPPPGVPGPFALAEPRALAAMFTAAWYSDVRVEPVPTPMVAGTYDEWWSRTAALAGPVANLIAGLDAAQRSELDARLRAAVAPYERAGRVEFPGIANLATATRR